MFLALGLGTVVIAGVILFGLGSTAERLILNRPGLLITPLGFIFLCTAIDWLSGDEQMNASLMMFIAKHWVEYPVACDEKLIHPSFIPRPLAAGRFMCAWHDALTELPAVAGSHKMPAVTGRKGHANKARAASRNGASGGSMRQNPCT